MLLRLPFAEPGVTDNRHGRVVVNGGGSAKALKGTVAESKQCGDKVSTEGAKVKQHPFFDQLLMQHSFCIRDQPHWV